MLSAKHGPCVKHSLLLKFYWNQNTLVVLQIHDLLAFWVIFYLICVGVNVVMTALAAVGSWPPHRTLAVVGNAHTFIQAVHNRMHCGCWCRSLFPATAESSGSLTSKFDFAEHPGPGMVPSFSGQALISWTSSRTAPQACRSCLQGCSSFIHEPLHLPGPCPRLMLCLSRKKWGFYIFHFLSDSSPSLSPFQ